MMVMLLMPDNQVYGIMQKHYSHMNPMYLPRSEEAEQDIDLGVGTSLSDRDTEVGRVSMATNPMSPAI